MWRLAPARSTFENRAPSSRAAHRFASFMSALNAAVRRALKDRDDVLLPEDFAKLTTED